jgi:AraC-like DNA-binding protein
MSGGPKLKHNTRQSSRRCCVPPARFFLWAGSALFLGTVDDASEHAHHALQVVVGVNGSFVLETSGKTFEYRSVVIAPDQAHRFRGAGGVQAIILLDAESSVAQVIQETICREAGVTEFDIGLFQGYPEKYGASMEDPPDCGRMKLLCQQMLSELADQLSVLLPLDPRIRKALEYVKSQPDLKAPLKGIAEEVCLSESRLVNLFREQVGIPIRRYLLWLRIIDAIGNLFENVSLTTAAHSAGFADSAHFTRTFREMFGITPSELFKNSQFVQVIPCPE